MRRAEIPSRPYGLLDRGAVGGGYDDDYDESPSVTPIMFPLDYADEIIEHERPMAPEPWTPRQSSDESLGPATPPELTALDDLWRDVREAKERGFKKPVVVPGGGVGVATSSRHHPLPTPPPLALPPPQHIQNPHSHSRSHPNKKDTNVIFRESSDGRTVTAIFAMDGVRKEDMHVSFHPYNLTVTWHTITIVDEDEGERVIRERIEKHYSHSIPLPEGTKFEEVRASKDARRLTLKYPSMRMAQPRTERRPVDRTRRTDSSKSAEQRLLTNA
ncbi:hypothetical protein JAAARDRAFT_33917 [Jaapia argillacea MUCL 33604]|uniref:SHSP domain-containing protein n=1 Tax=Jaapia argillacea MUCL 33604 TaxID=933084 RepID=A0A067PZ68_9AGAM|nr:hypothetical protein JAAARDRAFT_33917 [Jaapia argillacea MUCL 33604]